MHRNHIVDVTIGARLVPENLISLEPVWNFAELANVKTLFRAQCGLVKNMALLSHVTTFEDDKPIHRLLINLGVEVSLSIASIFFIVTLQRSL